MINTFLGEARKNPELNVRVSAYQQIIDAGYNTSEYFLTFTNIKKVGINPSSGYDTPNGIYTYPVKEILPTLRGNMDNVPFANEAPYIHILKKKNSGIVDPVESYSSGNLKSDIKKIHAIIKKSKVGHSKFYIDLFDAVIEDAMKTSFKKTPVSKFWNITKELSANRDFADIMGWGGSKSSSFKDFYDPKDTYDMVDDKKNKKMVKKRKDRNKRKGILNLKSGVGFNAQGWNNLLRMLGYKGFVDRNNTGTIHVNEPLQAMFLTTNAFTVVDSILNKSYERLARQDNYTEEINKLEDRHNIVKINGNLIGDTEKALHEIMESDIAEANIDYYDGNFHITGKRGHIEKANFKSPLIRISEITINGGWFGMETPMKDVIIYGGVIIGSEIDSSDIIGGEFSRCSFHNIDVISNSSISRCVALRSIMLFKCDIQDTDIISCGFSACEVYKGVITGSTLDHEENDIKGGCTVRECNINAGTFNLVRIEKCTIKGGSFETCRIGDTLIKGGTFLKIKKDNNVTIEGGEWNEEF